MQQYCCQLTPESTLSGHVLAEDGGHQEQARSVPLESDGRINGEKEALIRCYPKYRVVHYRLDNLQGAAAPGAPPSHYDTLWYSIPLSHALASGVYTHQSLVS